MTPSLPPDRIRAHLQEKGPIAGDVHAVADTAWELLSSGLLDLPLPREGSTIVRWWSLVEVAAVDLAVAQLVERHLEAQAIHAEAGRTMPDGLWSVWSDDGPESRLVAEPIPDGWQLTGTKRWCSGARSITTALVTARDNEGTLLFALPTRDPAVRFDPASWPAVGLALTDTLHMTVDGLTLPNDALVGQQRNWYTQRPGAWATAAGAAAGWYGGALGLARGLRNVVSERETDAFGLSHLATSTPCAAQWRRCSSGQRVRSTAARRLLLAPPPGRFARWSNIFRLRCCATRVRRWAPTCWRTTRRSADV